MEPEELPGCTKKHQNDYYDDGQIGDYAFAR
jgi:hypothetical protein